MVLQEHGGNSYAFFTRMGISERWHASIDPFLIIWLKGMKLLSVGYRLMSRPEMERHLPSSVFLLGDLFVIRQQGTVLLYSLLGTFPCLLSFAVFYG